MQQKLKKKQREIKREIAWLQKEKYLGLSEAELLANIDYQDDLDKLAAEEPIDYVIGYRDFLGCRIDLSMRPLIPRVETENWVEQAIKDIKKGHGVEHVEILDLFAGSGCIGIAVLKHLPNASVNFGEISQSLHEQIHINCKLNGISETRYNIIETDVLSNISRPYDCILANPPYIATEDEVQNSVTSHEPHNALFAGEAGMDYIAPLLERVRDFLRPGGRLYMEFGSGQRGLIEAAAKEYDHSPSQCEFRHDQYNKWRVLVLSS